MISNEEIFEVLKTKGTELSNWLEENFNSHTAIVITAEEVKIVETHCGSPAIRGEIT